jgi:hypothetical protein
VVRINANVERVAAREAGDAVFETAEVLAERAENVLAQHRQSGRARITVTRSRKNDAFVNLEDRDEDGSAISIEYGRGPDSTSGEMQGIYPLHRAIGMRGG